MSRRSTHLKHPSCGAQERADKASPLPEHAASPVADYYEPYVAERGGLNGSIRELAQTLDKSLLTLSAGAIGLSLAFLKDIVGAGPARAGAYLSVAWIALVVGIILVLVGMYLSQKGHERFVELLDSEAEKGGAHFWTRVRAEQDKSPYRSCVGILSALSLLSFVVGLSALLYFAYSNCK